MPFPWRRTDTQRASGRVYKFKAQPPSILVHLPRILYWCYFAIPMAAMGVSLAMVAALLICIHAQGAIGATFVVKNQCVNTVWAAGIPVGGGKQLGTGESWTVQVPAGTAGARFWGRTGCSFDQNGQGSCTTGDCGGLLECQHSGNVPATLAEYSLNQANNVDYYDVSLVDGFNLPLSFTPTNAQCKRTECTADVNSQCPAELKVTDGCKSACVAFNTPQYCCTGAYVDNCPPSDYSKFFKGLCPQAYSYAKDDQTSTFTCPSGTTDYNIVFCG